jgi:ACR3 family arsenite efflux pump ArsB
MLVFFELKSIVKLFRLLYVSFFVGVHVDVLHLLLDQEELSDVHILHAFCRIHLFTGTLSNVKLDSLPEAIVVDVVH